MMGLTTSPRRFRPAGPIAPGDPWNDLRVELDHWATLGREATFWWRDDDAVSATPALDRMLELANTHKAPLAVAVIPARAQPSLFPRLGACAETVTVLQHGYAHTNHATPRDRKAELGGHRPTASILDELAQGRAMLERAAPGLALPVLVPPWNRIDATVTAGLAGIGLRGLSTAKPRAETPDAAGLIRANTHVDPIDWPALRAGAGGFIGLGPGLGAAIGHLRARRLATVDPAEPTGLLTHHLVMDEPTWGFVDRLLALTSAHPAARWLSARAVFAIAGRAGAGGARA